MSNTDEPKAVKCNNGTFVGRAPWERVIQAGVLNNTNNGKYEKGIQGFNQIRAV